MVSLPLLFFLILFDASTAAFLTKKNLCFTWRLVSVDNLVGTCTNSDITNSLMSGLKFLKKFTAMSNNNTESCGSASVLKRNQV